MALGSLRGVLLTTALVAMASLAWPANAAHTTSYTGPPLQPGDFARSDVTDCTLGYAFKQASNVYFAIAGHCVNLNSQVSSTDFANFGTVVYKNTVIDVALIQVKDAFKSHVSGEVKGYIGVPSGYTRSTETEWGDPVGTSGYGLGFGTNEWTQENRFGIFTSDDTVSYCADLPSWYGDSGAPVTHGTKALGIVNGNGANCGATVWGMSVEGILAWTRYHGYRLELITV